MTQSNKNLQIMKYVINLMQHDFNEDADSAYRVKLLILKKYNELYKYSIGQYGGVISSTQYLSYKSVL